MLSWCWMVGWTIVGRRWPFFVTLCIDRGLYFFRLVKSNPQCVSLWTQQPRRRQRGPEEPQSEKAGEADEPAKAQALR